MIIDELQREKFEKVLKKLAEQLAAAKETDEELLILETDLEVLKTLNFLALKCQSSADRQDDLWGKAVQNLKDRKGLEIIYILDEIPNYFLTPNYPFSIEETGGLPIEKKALEQRLPLAWRVMEVIDEVIRLSLPEKR